MVTPSRLAASRSGGSSSSEMNSDSKKAGLTQHCYLAEASACLIFSFQTAHALISLSSQTTSSECFIYGARWAFSFFGHSPSSWLYERLKG
jgi:hypothetical protein